MSDSQGLETAIGVISGTSMDGIDVALIESDGEAELKTGPAATFPYPPEVAQRLRAVVADLSEAQAPQLELERLVTDAHVAAVEAFLDRFSIARERVALVGLHGQTILHRPRAGLTRQLCDGARAAAALKIDVVSDFRSADVAAGGEGAPLAPIYHAAMAAGLERPLMILNWGGVGNVTYLGAKGEIIAFDTGPANALIDDFLILRRGLAFDEGRRAGRKRARRLRGARHFDERSLFRSSGAQIARPQSFQRRRGLRQKPERRGWRGDARRLHGRIDRGRAEACRRRRRRAGWSAAADGETRASCAGLPSGCK